ncbi:M56 family metallopeptidase [Chryseobacterium sp.]|uniref:M56 family metallopeptidase n=1 Tax=Chryseobacterium sp. TaxID=1871047 RepID=UPI00388DEFD9
MEALLFYLGKLILCSGVLFLYYQLSLKDKTFHHYNRFYLLSAVLISIILPLVKVENFTIEVSKNVYLLMSQFQTFHVENNNNHGIIYSRIMYSALVLVSLFFVGKLSYGIFTIFRLKRKFPQEKFGDIQFYQTNLEEAPFSYFKNLFWKDSIALNSEIGKQILKHEMVHIEQKHSYDKIFMEVITALFWFNPIFYLFKKEVNLIHEYLADHKAVKQSDTKAFAQMLLASHFSGTAFPATSPFLSSNLKKRLKMLQKPQTKYAYARRILALPVVFTLAFSYMVNAKNNEIKATNEEIDAAVKMMETSENTSSDNSKLDENAMSNTTIAKDTIAQPKVSNLIITKNDGEYHPLRQKIVDAKSDDVFLIKGKKVSKAGYLKYFDNNREVPNLVFSHSVPRSEGAQSKVFSVEHSDDSDSQKIRSKVFKENNASNDLVLFLNKIDKTPEEKEVTRQKLLDFRKNIQEKISEKIKSNSEVEEKIANQRKESLFDRQFYKDRDYVSNPLTAKELKSLTDDAKKIERLNSGGKSNFNYGIYNAKEYVTKIFDFEGKLVNTDNSNRPKIKTSKMMISTDGAELYVNGKKVNNEEFKKYQSDFKIVNENPTIKSFIIERVGDAKRSYAKKLEIITDDIANAKLDNPWIIKVDAHPKPLAVSSTSVVTTKPLVKKGEKLSKILKQKELEFLSSSYLKNANPGEDQKKFIEDNVNITIDGKVSSKEQYLSLDPAKIKNIIFSKNKAEDTLMNNISITTK